MKKVYVIAVVILMLLVSLPAQNLAYFKNNYETQDDGDCTPTGYEYGNWSFSEHINNTGVLEEEWFEHNNTDWYVSPNYSSWWANNYTYEVNLTAMDVNRDNTFAVLNHSGLNRTQGAGWLHWNMSQASVNPPYPYIIFAYNSTDNFDCVMWHQDVDEQGWILHWDGTQFTDIHNGTVITIPETTGVDVSTSGPWEQGYFIDGWCYKYIYNEQNGSIKFKYWDPTVSTYGIYNEPNSWFIEDTHINITNTTSQCQGIGVWDLENTTGLVQWDIINVWELNYTVNTSAWINISGHNESRPHMDYPVLDTGSLSEEVLSYLNNTLEGNLSSNALRTIIKDNITNPINMESRAVDFDYFVHFPSTGEQNDTVYYYSCVLDNYTQIDSSAYDEYLRLHVQYCPEDRIRSSEYADILIGIDVDNNRQQNKSDRVYWAYADSSYDITQFAYNGNGDPIEDNSSYNIYNSSIDNSLNLHRYNTHINFVVNIPLADLIKEDGHQLTTGDVFGLCIITTNASKNTDSEMPCVWQNWNETSESPYYAENSFEEAMTYFFNYTDEHDGPIGNSTGMGRWGEGEITGTMNDIEGKLETNISVNKTVWNGTAWTTRYNASAGETVTFNITVVNNGNVVRNLVIRDNHYDAVRHYIEGSSNITYPDGTRVNHEPNLTGWEDSCEYLPHGHMQWNISATNLTAHGFGETGAELYLTYNFTISSVNYSENEVCGYLCEAGYDWWDAGENESDCENIWLNWKFNTNITCNCSYVNEESNWTVSEHMHRDCMDGACYDEEWFEYETNYTVWAPYNTSWHEGGVYDWNWTYHYNGTGDDMNLSYTIANLSCTNRSMTLLRMRYNVTDPYYEEGLRDEPCIGIIYSYTNDSYYHMVLYSYQAMYLLSKYDGILYDSITWKKVYNQTDATNYYEGGFWTTNSSMRPATCKPGNYGIWTKTIWNSLSAYGNYGRLQTKAWDITALHNFGLEFEPPGWIFDGKVQVRPENSSCFGLVVWSNTTYNFTADFDFIEHYRLNYSRDAKANESQLENHSVYGSDGIPLMFFPVYDKANYMTDYNDWYYNCYWEYFNGNITAQEYADCSACLFKNITNGMSMESRAFRINDSVVDDGGGVPMSIQDYDNQNDTIYYYTALFSNMSQYGYPYNNSLYLQIEECTDGTEDTYDGYLICVDVDNDMSWDDNDICIYVERTWDPFFGFDTHTVVYNGTNIMYNVYENTEYADSIGTYLEYESGPQNWELTYGTYLPMLHRFNNHSLFVFNIPITLFEKDAVGSGNYLNVSDTFGLHVMTIDDDLDYCPVWENWNESSDTNYTINDNNGTGIWNVYMNCTNWFDILDFVDGDWDGVTDDEMQYWAHGRIGNNSLGKLEYTKYSINMTKIANVTTITHIEQDSQPVNFTIQVCNNGEEIITNVTVVDNLPPCMDVIACSLPGANYSETSPGNWTFNVTGHLAVDACISFNFTVNVTGNCVANGTILTNWVNATTNESAIAIANCTVKYGTNKAPIITNHYPLMNRTITEIALLLADINVTIADPNGDTMDLYFFTNKTNGYYEDWNPIGSNLTQNNGTYSCNQTFNFSFDFNTLWRWGATVYYFSANVTDGQIWTNETFYWLTDYRRMNMNAGTGTGLDSDIDIQDATLSWNHRTGESPYYGIYNVAGGDEDVDIQDATTIWNNRD